MVSISSFFWDLKSHGTLFLDPQLLGPSDREHFPFSSNRVGSSDQGPFPPLLHCICISGPIASLLSCFAQIIGTVRSSMFRINFPLRTLRFVRTDKNEESTLNLLPILQNFSTTYNALAFTQYLSHFGIVCLLSLTICSDQLILNAIKSDFASSSNRKLIM